MRRVFVLLACVFLLTSCLSGPEFPTPGKYFDILASPEKGNTIAKVHTNKGVFSIILFGQHAPKTVENFAKLAEEGFYDDLLFHRIVPNFVVQGGDPKGNGRGGPGYTLLPEMHDDLYHVKGIVAMARLPDSANPGRHSNGSQFYIAIGDDAAQLDGKYTIFGYVYSGMSVVDIISSSFTDHVDKPYEDVIIDTINIHTY